MRKKRELYIKHVKNMYYLLIIEIKIENKNVETYLPINCSVFY